MFKSKSEGGHWTGWMVRQINRSVDRVVFPTRGGGQGVYIPKYDRVEIKRIFENSRSGRSSS